mmetsp:Transcript_34980/g.76473  ORF Transcript_34980/g.76473 Transcript_34980/m.76473 type:complete len:249 (+) Transcript_34980:178-924(+)|eukprot:CAMPEP_0118929424 /NCGR_PEP_ID=MMETSP1169-20130426/6434_1 /TAXON_ID=36882 /ORGANISM="Pyramimonas obovata, Strain CCMP722" /LENGTH=248 /DNA_ID=CAMNT_0006871617 /DNA_START=178 /DNA_END=924 /DNA_ORIENTATION=-
MLSPPAQPISSDVSSGANQCPVPQPEQPTVKRKRGRPKGSTKKVVSSGLNNLLLPTSASGPPLATPTSMAGWLGAMGSSMVEPDVDTAKKSRGKQRQPAGETKDPQLVPMSLIVQPNQDITEEIIRIARTHECSVCVLSAHGAVSGVTLKQCLSGVVTVTKGPLELMTLSGLLSPQANMSGSFLNATLSTSGGLICGSVVGEFRALVHVHVVVGLLKAPVISEPSPPPGPVPLNEETSADGDVPIVPP